MHLHKKGSLQSHDSCAEEAGVEHAPSERRPRLVIISGCLLPFYAAAKGHVEES